jgi:hypothetical protein
MDLSTAIWVAAAVIVVAFGALVYGLVEVFSRGRLMRCPETDSITFVRVASAAPGEGKAPGLRVEHCDFWPEKRNCSQGCLARYSATSSAFRLNADALRPFKHS